MVDERVALAERPRHDAASKEALRDSLGPFGAPEVDKKEVRDAGLDVPAQVGHSGGQAATLGFDALDVPFDPRPVPEGLRDDRDGDRGHGTGWAVWLDQFKRVAFRNRKADPKSGERIRLAGSPNHDQTRVRG